MENDKVKNSEPTPENIKEANKGYNSKDRDFQRTEQDLDDVSKSEKTAEEKNADERKERLKEASTTPNKNRIG